MAAARGYWWILHGFGDYSLRGNAVLKLDLALLGESHIYKGEGVPFDPEGILSTLPAIGNVLAGYAAAMWLQRQGRNARAVLALVAAGVLCLLLAWGWDQVLPINKKLWTGSFVLCTVTCMTPTGSERIQALFAGEPRIQHCYLPFTPCLVRGFCRLEHL